MGCAQSKDIIADDCFCPGTPVAATVAPSTTPVRDDSDCGTEEAYKEAGTCGTGGCYDVDGSFSGTAHRCACQENSCNESLCAEVGGSWTSGCTSAWCNNGWCDVVNGLVDAPVDDAPVDDAPVDDAPGDGTPVEDDSDCGTEEAYKEAGTCGTGGCYDVDGSFSGIAHRCACQENSCNE